MSRQMNFDDLVRPEVQKFLRVYEDEDERALVLKHREILGISSSRIAGQIISRRKAKEKLPSWYATTGIVYPAPVNIEQSSSEITAALKCKLIQSFSDAKISSGGVDLTGGFGVDSLFLSNRCPSLDVVEPDATLLAISRHNHDLLGTGKIKYHPLSAADFIAENRKSFGFIFLDPSRRINNSKVFKLSDCEPNAIALIGDLFEWTDIVVIKASPLLDLAQGYRDLPTAAKIVVIAVRNEVKEVLFFCRKDHREEPMISCVNFITGLQVPTEYNFSFRIEKNSVSRFSDPLEFIYEPNAAILKAGAFKAIGESFGLSKLHRHTHLYTSSNLVDDFPGRIFRVEKIRLEARDVKRFFPSGKANVITRNYSADPVALKKSLNLADGGEKFLIGYTGISGRYLTVADKISKR